jgi:hypothetical protein
MFKKTAAALLLTSGLIASGAQAATYSNIPVIAGSELLSPKVTTLGETFIAPTATLQDFSFLMSDLLTVGSGNASFVIASWNKDDTIGNKLYSSTINVDSSGFGVSSVGVSGLNLTLTAGSEYVAYLTVNGVKNAISNAYLLDGLGGSIGTGLYFGNASGTNSTSLVNLAYTANFAGAVAAVPEPATYGMLLAGLAMTAGFAARRRRG